MYYAILGEDNENSLELRHKARPAHIVRVQALAWANADPYLEAGVYKRVTVKPFKKVFP
jgi:uncharacterized protein YciI